MSKLWGTTGRPESVPVLDPGFIPPILAERAFLAEAEQPFAVAVERDDSVSVFETRIHGTDCWFEDDLAYTELLAKTMLWLKGGYRLKICGNETIAKQIKEIYSPSGRRAFDAAMMEKLYGQPFMVECVPYEQRPQEKTLCVPPAMEQSGCRIGLKAGASCCRVCAIRDGEIVYSGQMPWEPKQHADPQYHYEIILGLLRQAAIRLPKIDAIGISAPGVFAGNYLLSSPLFQSVPEEVFVSSGQDLFIRAGAALGDQPLVAANDGDTAAMLGAMQIKDGGVLGISMGTSQAGGYIDGQGCLTGWLNELAYVPVDCQMDTPKEPWSGDYGCGSDYFSRDAVIRLAPLAGITLSNRLTLAEKAEEMQRLAEAGHEPACAVFDTIGCYLGHTLPYYAKFYDLRHVLLMGGALHGKAGERLLNSCKNVLQHDYPSLKFDVILTDEQSKLLGQCIAAAALPKLR